MNKVSIRLPGYDRYAINYLRKRDIDILNIIYSEEGNIYTIYSADLEKLDSDIIEIVSYKGIKKFFKIVKMNSHFLFSIILSIVLMVAFSKVVVQVEVIHSNKDVRVLIEDELYDHGIKPFSFKKSFDELQDIKKKIKDDYPENIEWLEIVDDGMKYTVRVEERIITKPVQDPQYCNVVSTKDSIVLSGVAKKGQMVVAPNDFVKKDSILISGKITFNEATKSYVCGDGEVFGNTWYRVAISIPIEHTNKNFTGKKKGNVGFEFGSTYNRVFKIHFDDYDVSKKKIFSLGKFALYKETVEEYEEETLKYSEEEALEEALKQAREKLMIKLDSQSEILSENVLQTDSYDSIISVEVFYSVKEIISNRVEAQVDPEEMIEEKAE